MRIASIGEVLWDVIDGREHLGGAPLNFAAHVLRLGHDVRFLSGVGRDVRGDRALARMAELGLDTRYVHRAPAETGVVTVEFQDGQPQFRIHRPAAYDAPSISASDGSEISAWGPEWIYFGTLAQTSDEVHATVRGILDANSKASRFYDVNLRVGCYTRPLIRELLEWSQVVKLNDFEIEEASTASGLDRDDVETFCLELAAKFDLQAVCVTRGAEGCSLLVNGTYVEHPAYAVRVADTVGAGDAFSAALVHGLGERWDPTRIAEFCNRVGALVASRQGATPDWNIEEIKSLKLFDNQKH